VARDPYQELGVSRDASPEAIRKAFHKLAKAHHPDVNPGDKPSEERFKRASGAFDLLGDPEKRRKFDAGEIDADGRELHPGFSAGPSGRPGPGEAFEFEGVDLNEILGEMLGGRGRGGRGGGQRRGGPARGGDIRARLEIDIEDAVNGAKQRLSFPDGPTLEVNIPAGASEGQVLRLKGQGAPGRAGPGDALIELTIRPHPVFRREGDALVMDLPVSVPDAVLGGKVEAPTPEGPVFLSVPKGSNSGAVLRLKGRGLSDGHGRRGDLMARLVVTLPDEVDETLTDFAESWRRERPYTPRRRG
jgi:DnaJ-class molecular chaperone